MNETGDSGRHLAEDDDFLEIIILDDDGHSLAGVATILCRLDDPTIPIGDLIGDQTKQVRRCFIMFAFDRIAEIIRTDDVAERRFAEIVADDPGLVAAAEKTA